eukprot:1187161-Amphidinium_carterae.1
MTTIANLSACCFFPSDADLCQATWELDMFPSHRDGMLVQHEQGRGRKLWQMGAQAQGWKRIQTLNTLSFTEATLPTEMIT